MFHCPKCGHEFLIPLPCEPLYSLASACLIIPCSMSTLEHWLHDHNDKVGPPLYRRGKRPVRLLPMSDVLTVRAAIIGTTRYPNRAKRLAASSDTSSATSSGSGS